MGIVTLTIFRLQGRPTSQLYPDQTTVRTASLGLVTL